MIVSAWNNGGNIYGIRVGAPNRREYFSRDWTEVEVELDGQPHTFALTDKFWADCPEIRDRGRPFLREWLERHHTLDWEDGEPPKMELTPLGEGRFRLEP